MSVHRQQSGKKSVFYFSCNRFKEFTTEKCGVAITETTLEKTVKAAFDAILLNNGKSYKEYLKGYEKVIGELDRKSDRELTEINRKYTKLSRLQSEYYEKYVLGEWTKETFEKEKDNLNQRKKELEIFKEKQISTYDEEKFKLQEQHKYLEALIKGKKKKWDKDFVTAIIDKIFIGKDNSIEIKFNFEEKSVVREKLGGKVKRC